MARGRRIRGILVSLAIAGTVAVTPAVAPLARAAGEPACVAGDQQATTIIPGAGTIIPATGATPPPACD